MHSFFHFLSLRALPISFSSITPHTLRAAHALCTFKTFCCLSLLSPLSPGYLPTSNYILQDKTYFGYHLLKSIFYKLTSLLPTTHRTHTIYALYVIIDAVKAWIPVNGMARTRTRAAYHRGISRFARGMPPRGTHITPGSPLSGWFVRCSHLCLRQPSLAPPRGFILLPCTSVKTRVFSGDLCAAYGARRTTSRTPPVLLHRLCCTTTCQPHLTLFYHAGFARQTYHILLLRWRSFHHARARWQSDIAPSACRHLL